MSPAVEAMLASLATQGDGAVEKIGNRLRTGPGGGITFTYASTPPTVPPPTAGDQWLDSDTAILFVYVDDGTSQQWVEF